MGPQKKNIEILKAILFLFPTHYYLELYRIYPANIDGVWNCGCWFILITNQNPHPLDVLLSSTSAGNRHIQQPEFDILSAWVAKGISYSDAKSEQV